MLKKQILPLLTFLLLTGMANRTWAETVLEKVARTGELNAATRTDAVPFGYLDENGKADGYAVDLITLIQQKLEKQLGKSIKLNLKPIKLADRFKVVENGSSDIVCEATTITEERLERVNFSIPFFMSGAQFLIKKADEKNFNINGMLEGIPIAYLAGTTTYEIIPQIYPSAKWVAVKDRQEGIAKLKKGEVKAVVSDGILLIGELVKDGNNPKAFALTPKQPITTELYGCILPKNDSAWKGFVDSVVASPENHDLQEEWFSVDKSKFPYIVRTDPR